MTLEEKVRQLFVLNGFGTRIHDKDPQMVKLNREFCGLLDIAGLTRKFKPGGHLFRLVQQLEESGKILGLSNGIQRVSGQMGAGVPMLISADQEEEVTRIGAPAAVFPGNMELGATRSLGLSQKAARITGKSCGR